jgi:hypothetical protein
LPPAVTASSGRDGGSVINLSAFIREAAKTSNDADQVVIIALDRIDEIHKYDRTLVEQLPAKGNDIAIQAILSPFNRGRSTS